MHDMPESASQPLIAILGDKLVAYRGWTLKAIDGVPDDWIYRIAGWSECTIGWHMGHLSWKLDSYAELYFGQPQQLDSAWQRGFYSDAPLDLSEAPTLERLWEVFEGSHARFAAALAACTDNDLPRADPSWPDGTLLGAVANVLMHEGEHLAGIEALVWHFRNAPD
jgi:hypothetical protein